MLGSWFSHELVTLSTPIWFSQSHDRTRVIV